MVGASDDVAVSVDDKECGQLSDVVPYNAHRLWCVVVTDGYPGDLAGVF